jgi:amino acid adenylation domain-containing protein
MKHESVQEMFGRAVVKFRDKIAIERLNDRVTYGELEDSSNRLANYLLSTGIIPGSIVAILAEDTIEVVTAMIAVLRIGGVFVPLDPHLPEKRARMMVAEVSPALFLVQSKFLDNLKRITVEDASALRIVSLDRVDRGAKDAAELVHVESYLAHDNKEKPAIVSAPDAMCYVYFTSGSTGRPKGIAGQLKGIDHFINWEIENFEVTEGTRVSQLTTPSFDAFLRDVFTPLCAGGTICAPESRETILDAAKLIDWLDEQQINLVHCVPSLFRSLLNQELRADKFPALRYILMSGERLFPSDVEKWTDVFGDRVRLVNLYGPTETTMTKFCYLVQPADKDRLSIPIGKPMEGARAVVLDAKGRTCPPGAVGEIHIRTPYRTLGYFKQPALTAEVFIPNPFNHNPNDLIYKTGDLGRILEDGNFEFLGRKDQQVKIRGVRIEIAEIETVLREHEWMKDAAVVDLDDASGGKYLCAYVVLKQPVEVDELKQFLGESLPVYLIPTAFVMRDALPRTLSGKIDRKALPTPGEARAAHGGKADEPRNPLEELLVGIWSSVLGLPALGIHENFFALGGHSLLATQLLARVRKLMEVDLPLRSLFESPTVAGLAQRVEAVRQGEKGCREVPLEAIARDGVLPLSFAQQRLWFIDQLQPGSIFYNISTAIRLEGSLHVETLEQTLTEITRRHEVLRTSFETVDGKASLTIAPLSRFTLKVVDLSGLERAAREAQLERLLNEEPRRPFELAHGPLFRATLVKLEEETHAVLFTIHHIISDGWSLQLLVREVATLYQAFSSGKPSPLPELPVQYVDFAAWQRQVLQGETLENLLAYWSEQLARAPATLNLPLARTRPAVQGFSGAARAQSLPAALSDALKALSHEEGVTLFMTLLAGFEIFLHQQTGQEDLILGTPITNRSRVELEGLIGFFSNSLVLRADLSGDPTFRELLARVREVALAAYAHQDLPFDKLVEELRPDRNLSHNPLFQVAFTLDNPTHQSLELTGLTLTPIAAESNTVQLDLILHMVDTGKELFSSLQYSTDLFDEAMVIKMLNDFETLLQEIVLNPDLRLRELMQILRETEKLRWAARERALGEVGLQRLRTVKRKAINPPQI